MLDTVTAPEIAAKVFGGKTVQCVHFYKKRGLFPRPTYKLLGVRGQEIWFTVSVEKWMTEYFRLTDENKLTRENCMIEATRLAQEFDAEVKLNIATDRDGGENGRATVSS